MADTQQVSQIRRTGWWNRWRVVVVACGVLMAPSAAAAQQSGGTATEVRTPDLNGRMLVSEKVVMQRSNSNGEEQVLIETYLPGPQEGRLVLSRRVRRVTTARSDGSDIVEEIEELNLGVPYEPLRLTVRSETSVRGDERTGHDIERHVFKRDTNGRFVLVLSETEHRSPK